MRRAKVKPDCKGSVKIEGVLYTAKSEPFVLPDGHFAWNCDKLVEVRPERKEKERVVEKAEKKKKTTKKKRKTIK